MSASVLLGVGAGAIALIALAQAPGTRLTYRVRIVEAQGDSGPVVRVLGGGTVSGPMGTRLRLSLRTDTAEVEALVELAAAVSGGDSVGLGAGFFTRRRIGISRRGLPLWEQDTYRRAMRMAWSDTVRIEPFGRGGRGRGRGRDDVGLRVELSLDRDFLGGEARPAEELQVADSLHDFRVEAVVRPRRARVILNLLRGDTVSGPRGYDLVPEGAPRTVQLVLHGRATVLDLRLTRPEEPRAVRDRVLALSDDVVCLRVAAPPAPRAAPLPVGTICGGLTNVARRLPLPTGDTLLATFAWPGSR